MRLCMVFPTALTKCAPLPQNRASMTCMLYYESFNVLGLAGWGDNENHCKLLLVCLSCMSSVFLNINPWGMLVGMRMLCA